jgi:hypothetical protein
MNSCLVKKINFIPTDQTDVWLHEVTLSYQHQISGGL